MLNFSKRILDYSVAYFLMYMFNLLAQLPTKPYVHFYTTTVYSTGLSKLKK